MNIPRSLRLDMSTAILILVNILTIVFAAVQKWYVTDVMWVYWAQGIIIGLFTFWKLLSVWWPLALFHLFIYGFFHIVCFTFIKGIEPTSPETPALGIAICILAFLVNHGFSYWYYNKRSVNKNRPSIMVLIGPFIRIVPMYATILLALKFGNESTGILLYFLVFKMLMDVIMHLIEHRYESW